jgi:uncharacterized protein YegL
LALLAELVLLCGMLMGPVAGDDAPSELKTSSIEDILKAKKVQISGIKVALETAFASRNASSSLTSCFSGGKLVDGCGNQLPSSLNPTCSKILGNTAACECQGKKVVQKVAVKALDPAIDANGQRKASIVGCFAAGASMEAAFQAASGESDYDNKLMYFGSVDGVMAYYPGVLWARSQDYYGEKSCGADYDPRRRPWFLSGSTGPKNVIFILDSSGSMQKPAHHSRMKLLKTAAKAMMDGLTQADFVAVVDFDSDAKTFRDNKFMARASSSFRNEMKGFIEGLEAKGGTNYEEAFRKAFEIADTAYGSKYESGCQTVFVFLTDGSSPQDPTSMIKARKQAMTRNEVYFIIGLGADVFPGTTGGTFLQSLACDSGGIFQPVADPLTASTADVRGAESKLADALAGFARYFQAANAIAKRDVVTFSEVYEGANFPMRMTTASVPVYDKTTDPSRWRFLGVAGIDVTTCDMVKTLHGDNPSIQNCPVGQRDTVVRDCKCAEKWKYKGDQYSGCITKDWPFPWCASEGCGMVLDSVSTGYWADCKPFGADATLDSLLMKSGEECDLNAISPGQLEALRPPDYRCALTGGSFAAEVQQESASNFLNTATKTIEIPAPGFPATVVTSDWSLNPGTGGDLETQWSTDTSECDQCASTAMRPACAKPSSCPRSDGDVPELCHEDDGLIHEDGALVGSVIAVIIGLSVIVSLVMAFRRLCRQRQKVEVQVPPMQPMPAHAQMQAQPALVMQGVQVQASMQPPAFAAPATHGPPPGYGAPQNMPPPPQPAPPQQKFCVQCGQPTGGARFCPQCGASQPA